MPKTTTPFSKTSLPSEKETKAPSESTPEEKPREHVIRNILSFSRSLECRKSELVGTVVSHRN